MKTRDYWNINKTNFRALGLLSILGLVLFGIRISGLSVSASVPTLIYGFGVTALFAVVSFYVASLFKKRLQKAIAWGYIFVSVTFLIKLISAWMTGFTPAFILVVLIWIYVADCVRRAKKQGSASSVPSSFL